MVSRTKKVLLSVAALIVATFVSLFFGFGYDRSISFTDVVQDRAKLIDGFESYWGIQELEDYLKKGSLVWELEQGQRPIADDWRPPFTVDTVKIRNYSHLGFAGELHVMLFNNRLVSTMFFPREIDKYIDNLNKTEHLDLAQNREVKLSKHTRVWRAEAGQEKKKYVGWEDIRLSEEMSIWIKRYS